MRILSIGNSFSEDAQAHLKKIADASGLDIYCANLYIGGCPLSRHYRNMLSGENAYELGVNGAYTGIRVSLEQALLASWDIVTIQQASHVSIYEDSYTPYAEELVKYVRRYLPKAKIWVHETWAYVEDSPRFERLGCENQRDMYEKLHAAYEKCAESVGADGIIPCGTAFQCLLAKGAQELHRDGAHAGLGLGRFTLSATWLTALTGKDLRGIDWSGIVGNLPLTAEELKMAQEAAYEACEACAYNRK